jgi:hypothetical protein
MVGTAEIGADDSASTITNDPSTSMASSWAGMETTSWGWQTETLSVEI